MKWFPLLSWAVLLLAIFAQADAVPKPDRPKHDFKKAGGSNASDAAVKAGLEWLDVHQGADGRWSLKDFAVDGQCKCSGPGTPNDVAGTALALLAYLGRNENHQQSTVHAKKVERGLKYLIAKQNSEGDFAGASNLYATGMAAQALCESYRQTRDGALKEPCERSIKFILHAQHDQGGWTYRPKMAGDLSVTAWQIQALRAAERADLAVPKENLAKAAGFLKQVAQPANSYAYAPGRAETRPSMTAAGLLSRRYLAEERHIEPSVKGAELLLKEIPQARSANCYSWYFITRALYDIGGEPWNIWNASVRDVLVGGQEQGKDDPHLKGSWNPANDQNGAMGGRVMTTALSLMTLEVYYREPDRP